MAALVTNERAKVHPKLALLADMELTTLVAIASARIEQWCGRVFNMAERIEYHDGSGSRMLLLKAYPLVELSEVVIVESDGTETSLDVTNFDMDAESGEAWFAPWSTEGSYGTFVQGKKNIKITYIGGYALTDAEHTEEPDSVLLPEDLKEAVVLLAAYLLSTQRKDLSINGYRLDAYAETRREPEEGVPPEVASLAAPYRDIEVA